jgi:hypothetical protein
MSSKNAAPGNRRPRFFSPFVFDCVPPGFSDEGGGQPVRGRLWRLIHSILSMITITHLFIVTKYEVLASLVDISVILINITSSIRLHAASRHRATRLARLPRNW